MVLNKREEEGEMVCMKQFGIQNKTKTCLEPINNNSADLETQVHFITAYQGANQFLASEHMIKSANEDQFIYLSNVMIGLTYMYMYMYAFKEDRFERTISPCTGYSNSKKLNESW